ncbi:MAG: putative enoyl-CoA hydratase [Gemmatimonadetes bacterium]|nr:putative enoyl-CoA hydratase [Gemmatimonadota bacterium]
MTQSDIDAAGGVSSSVSGGIGTVRFHHPKGNSLPGNVLQALAAEIAAMGENPAAHVIVLRSEGTGPFCAGASFVELKAIRKVEQGSQFFGGFAKVILAMIRAPKFVLVRVHGKAAGGGVGLVSASDYAFAVRTASARLAELALGIGPFVIGPVVDRRVGHAAFAAMSVDADWRDADWGERHGLYSRVFDDVTSMDAALDALATTLAASNPDAMVQLKRVFWDGTEGWDALLTDRARMSGTLVLGEYTRSAIESFSAKPATG